jgi:hypothetical protein
MHAAGDRDEVGAVGDEAGGDRREVGGGGLQVRAGSCASGGDEGDDEERGAVQGCSLHAARTRGAP